MLYVVVVDWLVDQVVVQVVVVERDVVVDCEVAQLVVYVVVVECEVL